MLLKKYIPKKISEIVGQYGGIVKLARFVQRKSKKKAAIIYGEPGIGKTLAVRVYASEQNFELFEIPPSSTRNKEEILSKLRPVSTQPSLFGGQKIILIDELESFSGKSDRGGISALLEIIKNSRYPIILTANNPWKSKFKTLRKYCELIQFNPVDYKSIEKYLVKICASEKIDVEPVVLKKIAARSQGDVRSAILDLDVLSKDKSKIVNDDIYDLFREREESIFYAVKITLKSFDSKLAVSTLADVKIDSSEYILWIDQNMYQEYTDPRALRTGYIRLSDSDIFNQRISKNQNWDLTYYANLLASAGVQQSKAQVTQNISHYTRPELFTKIFSLAAKRRKAKGISEQISSKLHTSSRSLIRDFYPYFTFIMEKNPKMGKQVMAYLESE